MSELSRGTSLSAPETVGETLGPCVLKLLVSDRQAGKLIGKHGSTVSQIGASCHVSIRVSGSNMFFPSTTDRVVVIGGESVNVEAALRHVQDRVSTHITEAQLMTMLVHSSLLPLLLGQACSTLHRVAGEFGVAVTVGPKIDTIPERLVKISHSSDPQAVLGALMALASRVMSEPISLVSTQMNYDAPPRPSSFPPPTRPEIYLGGLTVEAGIASSPPPPGSDEEVHLAAASLLPLDEIKVDTDLLRGKRSAEADELVCKICHTYFLGCAPKLTKCAHAFCGDCLESWIQVQPTFRSWAQVAKTAGQARLVPCPVCKTPLNDKTDIHLILADSPSEPDCVRVASLLRSLPLVCHNNPAVAPAAESGVCNWEGPYRDYQQHARSCTRNGAKSVMEANTTAPPQSHQKAAVAGTDADLYTVVIPFTPAVAADTIPVATGDRVSIQERSDAGWIYVRNVSKSLEGWVPDYVIKRYDAWFEDLMGANGKHVEKCSALRDFDPKADPAIAATSFQFLHIREGEVFTVAERAKNGWNLVINSDGTKQGWVPDNRCKVIREGSDHPVSVAPAVSSWGDHSSSMVRSFVVRHAFEGIEKNGELSLTPGETVSVRQAHESGWTLGVVVAGGSKKEGWFPDWMIDRSVIDTKCHSCANCNVNCINKALTFVRTSGPQLGRPQDVYSPVCSNSCWEQWMSKRTAEPKPGQLGGRHK